VAARLAPVAGDDARATHEPDDVVRLPALTRRASWPLPAGAAIDQRRGGSTSTSFPRFSICAIAHAFSICAYV
jgi:hypothetical protein